MLIIWQFLITRLTNEPNEDIRWTTDKWTKWGNMLNHWQMTYAEPLANEPNEDMLNHWQMNQMRTCWTTDKWTKWGHMLNHWQMNQMSHIPSAFMIHSTLMYIVTVGKPTQTTWTWVLSKHSTLVYIVTVGKPTQTTWTWVLSKHSTLVYIVTVSKSTQTTWTWVLSKHSTLVYIVTVSKSTQTTWTWVLSKHSTLVYIVTVSKSTQTTWTWVLSKHTYWCLHKFYILVSSQKRVRVSFWIAFTCLFLLTCNIQRHILQINIYTHTPLWK